MAVGCLVPRLFSLASFSLLGDKAGNETSERKMCRLLCLVVCTCVLFPVAYAEDASTTDIPDNRLHAALHHFDVLHVNHLVHRFFKIKRTSTQHTREINFNTLNREFSLLLRPRKRLFNQYVTVNIVKDGESRPHPLRFDEFYEGILSGEADSSVVAHYNQRTGILTASIATAEEDYYIEPSHRHFGKSHDFHMISYRGSDLKYNLTGDPSLHFCGNPEHDDDKITPNDGHSHQKLESDLNMKRTRLRRARISGDACSLHLVASTQFHNRYAPTGDNDDSVLFMLLVIDSVDQIYRRTNFSTLPNLGFTVTNVTVYATADGAPIYNRRDEWNSEDLLRVFSYKDWSDVCLAHLFTSVELTDGRLGVAYVASDNNDATGGICSEYFRLGGEFQTANVGVSTYLNRDRQLLLAEAKLVTAHELGHNWGSEHDPTDNSRGGLCNPDQGPQGGKYLMFPAATDGTQQNNDDFSPCSIEMIDRVLQAKGTCFIESQDGLCGNYEVEEGEVCDGGALGMVNQDPCCNPNCEYKGSAICSDVNDLCCQDCGYASNDTVCQEFGEGNRECRRDILCTGSNKDCPMLPGLVMDVSETYVKVTTECGPSGKCLPPGTECSNNDSIPCLYDNMDVDNFVNVSLEVECFSFCQLRGLEECFCSGEEECYFCCLEDIIGNGSSVCRSFSVLKPEGTTCFGGICQEGECIPATQDLIQRLYSLFTDLTVNAFLQVISENIVGSVCILTGLVWVPIGIIIHCWDVYRWREHKRIAREQEHKRLLADDEDEVDRAAYDQLATMSPGLFSPLTKYGLMRLGSRSDSLPSDFFSGVDDFVFSPTSPTKPVDFPDGARRLSTIAEESQQLDPSRDNILAYMSSSPRQSVDHS